MANVISEAVRSIVQEPIKHAGNALSAGTGATVANDWLQTVVVLVSLCTTTMIFINTYRQDRINRKKEKRLDIELSLSRKRLADEGRREADK